MKIMGLKMSAFWLSWFMTYALIIMVGFIISFVLGEIMSQLNWIK